MHSFCTQVYSFFTHSGDRSGNPTRTALETLLAGLENADNAFCFSSGMSALMAVTQLLKEGEGALSLIQLPFITHSSFIRHSFIIHSSLIHHLFAHSSLIHHSFTTHSSLIPHSFITHSSAAEILACADLYGGMHRLLMQVVQPQGIQCHFVDTRDLGAGSSSSSSSS